jgi:hypothetical protein
VNLGFNGFTWLGSPGARWIIKKETTMTKNKVMIFWMMLRPMNDSITDPPR